MQLRTADLCDKYMDRLRIVSPLFHDYGKKKVFNGKIVTLKLFEDNVLVKEQLQNDGTEKVLVVDGGGSLRCALLGDNLAMLAKNNRWEGIIVYGCIRDSFEISGIDLGVKALNTCPVKSIKKGEGDVDIPVTFAGVTFVPGNFVYADEDGIVVSAEALAL